MSSKKPTREEIEASIAEVLQKDLELKNKQPDPQPTPSQEIPEPTPSKEVPAPTPSQEIPEPTPSKEVPAPEPTPSLPDTNLKKRYKESTKEANIMIERNKAVNDAIQKANELPEPTEEELIAENEDWDIMSDFEKKMSKESFINKRFRGYISEATKQFVDIDKWKEEIENFVGSEKSLKEYPEIVGKEGLFKEYASKIQYRGTPFEVLVAAFLNGYNQNKPKPNKGQMFPTGIGGPNSLPQPKSDKLTLAQGDALRKTDYRKWKDLLKAGKIENE